MFFVVYHLFHFLYYISYSHANLPFGSSMFTACLQYGYSLFTACLQYVYSMFITLFAVWLQHGYCSVLI